MIATRDISNRCTDAQKNRLENIKTFYAPTYEDLKQLNTTANNLVKICVDDKERFWVKLLKVEGDKLIGVIDNDLILINDLKYSDLVNFEKRHVYDINVSLSVN